MTAAVLVMCTMWIRGVVMNYVKKNILYKNAGFTLIEILVAVLILAILITMSVPMYEKAVEKSRIAEVSATLKRISEAKLRTMDSMQLGTFKSGSFSLSLLDVSVPNSQDFSYHLYPSAYPNAVCAKRLRGDAKGTTFLYLGEVAPDYCANSSSTLCKEYRTTGRKLFCSGSCDIYSMDSYSVGACLD